MFVFGKSSLQKANDLVQFVLDENKKGIQSHEWKSIKQKDQEGKYYNNILNLYEKLQKSKLQNFQEYESFEIKSYIINLIAGRNPSFSKNTLLIELNQYLQKQNEKIKKQCELGVQDKIAFYESIFTGEAIKTVKQMNAVNQTIRENINSIKEKVLKYDEIWRAIYRFRSLGQRTKFSSLLSNEIFSKREKQQIEEALSLESKREQKRKFEGQNQLTNFISSLKTNKKYIDFINSDPEGNYLFIFQKYRQTQILKQYIQKMTSEQEYESILQNLLYENNINSSIKAHFRNLTQRLIKLKKFKIIEKHLFSEKGFEKHFAYLQQLSKSLNSLENKYRIKSVQKNDENIYYGIYSRILLITSEIERDRNLSVGKTNYEDVKNPHISGESRGTNHLEKIREILDLKNDADIYDISSKIQKLKLDSKVSEDLKLIISPTHDVSCTMNDVYKQILIGSNQKVQLLEQKIQKYLIKEQFLEKKNSQLERQVSQLLDRIELKKQEVSLTLESTQNNISSKQKQFFQYKLKIEQDFRKKSHEKKNVEKQIQQLKSKNQLFRKQCQLLSQKIQEKRFGSFFQGALSSYESERKSLCFQLEKLKSKPIKKTNFLYQQDFKNPTNFHEYIDQKPSLLILIQLKSGLIIGGYCSGYLKLGHMPEGSSILFNLSKNLFFTLKNGLKYRGLIYDKYHIIIGNSEIQLRFEKNILQTNFGISSRHFDTGQTTLQEFMGENKRQIQFISYEIHQVEF